MSEPKFTPGPWSWCGSTDHTPRVYLAAAHNVRNWVMGFRRSGMQSAEPVFRVGGRMAPASEFVRFDVDRSVMGKAAADLAPSVYRQDFSEIDHPDAHLIVSAPALYEALETAAAWFDEYAASHAAKETDDGREKAKRNEERASACRATLAQARGEQP